uniref:Uncharacterized protein n=1 Tax=Trichinella nativa TaxID=6335 RepID=A0A0V1KH90_9BILA
MSLQGLEVPPEPGRDLRRVMLALWQQNRKLIMVVCLSK